MSGAARKKHDPEAMTREERAKRLAYIGTLASGLAHEIRSPLNGMKLNLDLLAERLEQLKLSPGKLDPEERKVFEAGFQLIGREVEGLQDLLTEFLQFARPPQMQKLATDLNELVKQVVELVAPECARAHVRIVLEFQEDLYPVPLDQAQFGRGVLLNLLTNAREQVGEQGTIIIRTRETGSHLEIQVEDNGGGVPAGQEEEIFRAFVSTKDHGTGLGLSIARRIVEEHGGELLLENHPGRGATFIARLPKSIILDYKKEA